MGDLFIFLGIFSIIVGLPALIILIIVELLRKNPVKKMLKAISIVFVAGICSISIGGNLQTPTDEYEEEKSKDLDTYESDKEVDSIEQVQTETTTQETEVATEVVTEQPTTVLTEEGYKNSCEEMYYDDFFVQEPEVGQYIKIHGFISGKYRYSSSSMSGILIRDIVEQYDLRKEYLGCCVMHEETKNDAVPSYFGKSIWLMFPDLSDLHIDNYDAGQHVLVYGEVVQNNNGIFVIPKYIEGE